MWTCPGRGGSSRWSNLTSPRCWLTRRLRTSGSAYLEISTHSDEARRLTTQWDRIPLPSSDATSDCTTASFTTWTPQTTLIEPPRSRAGRGPDASPSNRRPAGRSGGPKGLARHNFTRWSWPTTQRACGFRNLLVDYQHQAEVGHGADFDRHASGRPCNSSPPMTSHLATTSGRFRAGAGGTRRPH